MSFACPFRIGGILLELPKCERAGGTPKSNPPIVPMITRKTAARIKPVRAHDLPLPGRLLALPPPVCLGDEVGFVKGAVG